jgi:hypothetical protein
LGPQIDTLKKELPQEVSELRARLQQADIHLNIAEMLSQLLAGFDMMLKHAVDVGVITGE